MRSKASRPKSAAGEGRGVALAESDARTQTAPRDGSPRRLEHRLGDVDAVEAGVGIALRGADQIPRRAAANLKHRAAQRRLEASDQAVAAKKVVAPRGVVNEMLAAVDSVHFLRGCGGGLHRSYPCKI